MTSNEPSQSEINKIIDLVSKNLYQDALGLVNNLIQDYPDNALLFNIAGACTAGLGDLDDAVIFYKKAIEINPDYAKAFYNLAGTLQDMSEFEDSIENYKKSLEIEPNFAEAHNNLGNVYRELGELEEAVTSYQKAIVINNNYVEAIFSLGVVLKSLNSRDAIDCFIKAIEIKSDFAEAHNNLGIAYKNRGQTEDAIRSYKKALEINSNYLEAYNNLGNAYRNLGQFKEASVSYQKAIAIKQDYPTTHNNLGNVLKDLGRLEEAIESYKRAIEINPIDSEALNNLGEAYRESGDFDNAIESFKKALLIDSDNSNIVNNLGVSFKDNGDFDNAIESFKKALLIDSENSDVYSNLGVTYKEIGQFNEAIKSYKSAISLNPNDSETYNNLGTIYLDLGELDDAMKSYEIALKINPNNAGTYNNISIVLFKKSRFEDAEQYINKALQINPRFAECYANQGQNLIEMNMLAEALSSFEKANEINPNLAYNLGAILRTKMTMCNWNDLKEKLKELRLKINNNNKVIVPFDLLSLIDDPKLQKKTAEIYANDKFPINNTLSNIQSYPGHTKIRIGYFSADFRIHPVATLTAELYESHNRDKFEVHAFSFGPNTKDEMNLRIKAGVDHFHNVCELSHKEIVLLSRSLEIDIAVDLGGYTSDSRTGIFAMLVAPIQISYIGVLSTMGTNYYDYLVAGQGMIPESNQKYFSEKIVYLPSYQVNDSKEPLPDIYFSKKDLGVPDKSFVFCCFNNTYKITPNIFDSWARILDNVENSVMMIYISNNEAKKNLINEITNRGIDPERLIFVEKLPRAAYLARYRLADLFLDTHPYNAGTTASDALRMSVPILTLSGNSFNSREAASIINAVNLPEMITSTTEEYESLAIELANNPKKFKTIKNNLSHNLINAPLFDTDGFVKHFESALLKMYDRRLKGLDPDHIYIDNLNEKK